MVNQQLNRRNTTIRGTMQQTKTQHSYQSHRTGRGNAIPNPKKKKRNGNTKMFSRYKKLISDRLSNLRNYCFLCDTVKDCVLKRYEREPEEGKYH